MILTLSTLVATAHLPAVASLVNRAALAVERMIVSVGRTVNPTVFAVMERMARMGRTGAQVPEVRLDPKEKRETMVSEDERESLARMESEESEALREPRV